MENIVVAQDIWKRYGRSSDWVLENVTLTVKPGELVSITGENGSGKSTLLRILAGDDNPTRGTVTRTGKLGFCPQVPALYPRLTVDEHFDLYVNAGRYDVDRSRSVREEVLGALGFEANRKVQARALSGGTRAKLSLALSILGEPDCLVLDEPYAAFDLTSYRAFWDLIVGQRDHGRAVVIVSHLELDTERFDVRHVLRGGSLEQVAAR